MSRSSAHMQGFAHHSAPVPQPQYGGYSPPLPPPTNARLRWGRLVLALAGAALLGFAGMNMANSMRGGTTPGTERTAGGAAIDTALATSPSSKSDAAPADTMAPASAHTEPMTSTPEASTAAADAAQAAHTRQQQAKARKQRIRRRAARRAASLGAATRMRAGSAAAATATGGGANTAVAGAAALPKTGASVWIAALLGIAFLGAGVLMQVNAVRLGATALLYRRGLLLRPIDCARLATQHAPELQYRLRSASPALGDAAHLLLRPLRSLLQAPPPSSYTGRRGR